MCTYKLKYSYTCMSPLHAHRYRHTDSCEETTRRSRTSFLTFSLYTFIYSMGDFPGSFIFSLSLFRFIRLKNQAEKITVFSLLLLFSLVDSLVYVEKVSPVFFLFHSKEHINVIYNGWSIHCSAEFYCTISYHAIQQVSLLLLSVIFP